jgi:DNA end-binding protein Ku
MRAIWKGSISFGLVNIPVGLYPATKAGKQIKFHLLRRRDQSPIKYKRVAEEDGKEVAWEDIVKGFEYQKGNFVVLDEEDFEAVKIKSTQTVDIKEFVNLDRIDPMFYDQPYFLGPEKGGAKAYAILREALKRTKKVGIAKVVIKTREHLAAVKPMGEGLVLELMHFADELADPAELKLPPTKAIGQRELGMAESLIQSMFNEWDPDKYKDEYREALIEVINDKIKSGGKRVATKKAAPVKSTNVVDLVAVLQESLEKAQGGKKKATKTRRKAA